MVTITVTSERVGSNPGGKCIIPYHGRTIESYIKYCNLSHLPRNHPFNVPNQPIYEALTLTLASKLGLHVPEFWVLYNEDRSVNFSYEDKRLERKKLDSDRLCYLVSRLVILPRDEDAVVGSEMQTAVTGETSGIKKRRYRMRTDEEAVLEYERLAEDYERKHNKPLTRGTFPKAYLGLYLYFYRHNYLMRIVPREKRSLTNRTAIRAYRSLAREYGRKHGIPLTRTAFSDRDGYLYWYFQKHGLINIVPKKSECKVQL